VVHLAIGKASFDPSHLLDNYNAVIEEINRAKPAAAKGRYIITVTLTTTMGPGVRVEAGRTGERGAAAEAAPAAEPAAEEAAEADAGSSEAVPA
jgi:large subunit ribosomal protein L1